MIPFDLSLFGDLHVKQIAFHTYRFFYKEKQAIKEKIVKGNQCSAFLCLSRECARKRNEVTVGVGGGGGVFHLAMMGRVRGKLL